MNADLHTDAFTDPETLTTVSLTVEYNHGW